MSPENGVRRTVEYPVVILEPMTIVAVVTGLVAGCLWILDKVDQVPHRRTQLRVAQIVLIPIVAAMLLFPGAYQPAMDWFIERKTNEILDWIQPAIDDLAPPSTVLL